MLVGGRWQTDRVPERDLLVLSEEPLNAETKLAAQRGPIVRAGRHYVRTHFGIPDGPHELLITGAVRDSPRSVTLEEVRRLPSRTFAVTLECAGNGRKFMEPPAPGEQWGLGAVGTAEWTGAALHTVLGNNWLPSAVEVLFRGADEGTPKDLGRRIFYERSLPIEVARGDDVLVAYAMNGQPIPREHGGPLRLIVPAWYGMASVKWLTRLVVTEQPYLGYFQTLDYTIFERRHGFAIGEIAADRAADDQQRADQGREIRRVLPDQRMPHEGRHSAIQAGRALVIGWRSRVDPGEYPAWSGKSNREDSIIVKDRVF